jgi:hypothetical protein
VAAGTAPPHRARPGRGASRREGGGGWHGRVHGGAAAGAGAWAKGGRGATCAAEEKGRVSGGRAAGESEGVEENERG